MFINVTTRQQISIYSIAPTDICLLVPPHLEKWGYKKISFRSLRSRILFYTPTLKSVAPPMTSWQLGGLGLWDRALCAPPAESRADLQPTNIVLQFKSYSWPLLAKEKLLL